MESECLLVLVIRDWHAVAVGQALECRCLRDGVHVGRKVVDVSRDSVALWIQTPETAFLNKERLAANQAADFSLDCSVPFPRDAASLSSQEVLMLMDSYLKKELSQLCDLAAVHVDIIPLPNPSALPTFRVSLFHGSHRSALEIRDYFGDSVALYFAWMHHYQRWLVFPAGFGVCTWLGAWWFDASELLLPLFSASMLLWTLGFAISWERCENAIAATFGCMGRSPAGLSSADLGLTSGFGNQRDDLRHAFRGVAEFNPVFGEFVMHYSVRRRLWWQVVSFFVTAVMLTLALAVQVLSLNFQGYMKSHDDLLKIDVVSQLSETGALFDSDGLWWWAPVVVHATAVLGLNRVFRAISMRLTELENYPTQTQHEWVLVLKRLLFEFVDAFAPLFYIAFYRRDLAQLQQELMSLYCVDVLRRVFTETVLPFLWSRVSRVVWAVVGTAGSSVESEQDKCKASASTYFGSAELEDDEEEYDSFDDYLEMMIQLAYVSLFSSAFPLAALLSLVSNVVELNSDLFKLLHVARRPMPKRCGSIGPWLSVMRALAYLSVVTNVAVFAYTSDQMKQLFPRMFDHRGDVKDGTEEYVVVGLFAVEHVALLVVATIDRWIPRVPLAAERAQRRNMAELRRRLQCSGDKKNN